MACYSNLDSFGVRRGRRRFRSLGRRRNVRAQIESFAPTDIDGLELWLDASAITGLSDGDPVTTWEDQSSNGFDATQATADNKPTYQTNELNGKPVVRFDGTNDLLSTSSVSVVGDDGTWTVFAVSDLTGGTGAQTIVDHDNLTRIAQFLRYSAGSAQAIAFNEAGGAFTDSESHGAGFDVISSVRSALAVQVFVNGTSGGSTATTGIAISGSEIVRIGSRGASGAHLAGDIAEVLIYSAALSTADREAVEEYLASKYGITLS